MENMGQTVQINVSSSTHQIILPCRPVHPTAISIKLFKLDPTTVSFSLIALIIKYYLDFFIICLTS